MNAFRDLVRRADAVIYEALSDTAVVNGRNVQGMFEHDAPQPRVGEIQTGLTQPQLTIRSSELCDITKGATVQVLNLTFVVVDIQCDGTLQTKLILRPKENTQEWTDYPSTLTFRGSKSSLED